MLTICDKKLVKRGVKSFLGDKKLLGLKIYFDSFFLVKNHMRSSKIRGEIVLQRFPHQNSFHAEDPGKIASAL